MMMDQRGWGWSTSEIRQAQLVEWIAQQPADQYVSVEAFYYALPDQAMNAWEVAHGDLKLLEERSLIGLTAAMGGIRALHVHHTQGARDLAEQLQAARANKRLRKAACRDAMVDWLYSRDATSPDPDMPDRDEMLADPQRGVWFAEPFSDADLDAAAAWLHRQGLVDGITPGECKGPVRLYLTDPGVKCAEDFDSYADRYVEAQERASGTGPTVQIGTNSGPFQVAGDNAHQVQNIGASTDELRKLIAGIAELVRALVPDASGVREAEQEALAAARAGAVDRSVLQRFADWALSTVRAGAAAAVVPAVSSATTAMLMEAGRLTGL